MPVVAPPIIYVTRGGAIIRTVSGRFTGGYSEPCTWAVVLDNSTGLYNPFSSIAQVRANAGVYHKIEARDPDASTGWSSPQLIVEDYHYANGVVTVSGRCRLAELDKDDQVIEVADGISTAENMTVADLADLICGHCGLTVTGAPDRVVREFNLVGNPLQLLRDLLEPTEVFYLDATGPPGQVVIESATSHGAAGLLKDSDDLEIVEFRRTMEIRNRATVERLVPQSGVQILFDEAHSGYDQLGPLPVGPFALESPSRRFRFTVAEGYRGKLVGIQLFDAEGGSVGASPFTQVTYVGLTPVASFRFVYELNPSAEDWGQWMPNWRVQIQGTPVSEEAEDPPTGYSATHQVGAGDRPYPEPYSSVAIDTTEEAEAAAVALVERGTRQGQIMSCSIRYTTAKMWRANQSLTVVDEETGLDDEAVIEAVSLTWSHSRNDSGTITYSCTLSEAA